MSRTISETPALDKRQQLIARGRELLDQIRLLDSRIAGLRMTPKNLCGARLKQMAAEREKLVAEYQECKKEFHSLDEK